MGFRQEKLYPQLFTQQSHIELIFENMKTLLVQAYESLPPGYFGQHFKL